LQETQDAWFKEHPELRGEDMKQQLDEVRTLAIKLFEAGEKEKRKQPKHIWDGQTRTWRDLPS